MRFLGGPVPFDASDDDIRAAVAAADHVPLLVATAHLTGDLSILEPELAPDQLLLLDPSAGLTPELLERGQDLAAQALIAHRDAGCPAPPPLDEATLLALITFVTGGVDDAQLLTLIREELALDDADPRAPGWRLEEVAPDRPFSVAVIGAGMSGIVAAHRLDQAGIDFTILEKDADVGGTWLENVYPGCRVDVANHFYSYSFAQSADWPQFFSTQDVLLDYFRSCADAFGLRPHIRFSTEVRSATWDDVAQQWVVRTRTGGTGGEEVEERFDAVISAVGQLNQPSFPDIEGRDEFAGPSFHSARWRDDVELAGKRVAIIGTGASAAQFIPPVAEEAGELLVFQRTAPWLIPTENYHDELSDGVRWLLHHVPDYARWDRLWIFWRTQEGLLPCATVDPDWPPTEQSVSMMNEFIRQMLMEHLQAGFPEPELLAAVVPDYPPLAKRFVRDNGIWARTMHRDDVQLVTTGIERITERGVVTVDGVEHDVDVVIYGTGFQASRFLTPMQVTGRGGVDLHEQWGGDARAYLGITVPNFPNLFLFYGPNTNIVVNGSIIYFSELEARYTVEAIGMLLREGKRALDCRPEVHDAYNAEVDGRNAEMAWSFSKVSSWYKAASGRSAQNWPFSLLEYWKRTLEPDPDDYVLT